MVKKGATLSEEHKKKISLNHADVSGDNNPFFGKHHSRKTKEYLSKIKKGIIPKNVKMGLFKNTGRTYFKKGEHISPETEFKKGCTSWNKGNKGYRAGIPRHNYDENFRNKVGKSHKGKKHSETTKRKMRESAIKYVEKKKLNGGPLKPNIGKCEKEILDNLELDIYPYLILRQYKVNGYFLDGYCPALNLAIEVDEKYHKNKEQLQKDIIRQNEIKKYLKCQFLRMGIGGRKCV